ncbi:MAG: hypothetical protein KF764_17960 [Labilithrix sp.]|nr:hypothetical protein [Labilithrix sp.]MBX3222719.1 hypothetical protein [Labilithrix sp.]
MRAPFRVILSLDKKTTTVAAPWRNGMACLAFEVRLHRAQRQLSPRGRVAGLNRSRSFVGSTSSSIFGGLLGLAQADSRIIAAPCPLDPSGYQEEGDP